MKVVNIRKDLTITDLGSYTRNDSTEYKDQKICEAPLCHLATEKDK